MLNYGHYTRIYRSTNIITGEWVWTGQVELEMGYKKEIKVMEKEIGRK